jgi:hypothetical protein
MKSYSHLSEDDQWHFAGCSLVSGAIAPAVCRAEDNHPGSCSGIHSPRAGIHRFTPREPINCACGVKQRYCSYSIRWRSLRIVQLRFFVMAGLVPAIHEKG